MNKFSPRKEAPMPQTRLRIYYGPESTPRSHGRSRVEKSNVRLPLGELFPLLADAVRSERTWLSDFEDDEITISADLYEVILAYQHCRRPSA